MVKAEIETRFGLKYRHDLSSENGGCMRGWKGLALIEVDDVADVQNQSVQSGGKIFIGMKTHEFWRIDA